MKIVVCSDIHGKTFERLEEFLLPTFWERLKEHFGYEKINKKPVLGTGDKFVCLGDLDQTKTIHSLIGLNATLMESGVKTEFYPGNHDDCFIHKKFITGKHLLEQLDEICAEDPTVQKTGNTGLDARKIFRILKDQLHSDNIAYDYLEQAVRYNREGYLAKAKTELKLEDNCILNIHFNHGALDSIFNPNNHKNPYANLLWAGFGNPSKAHTCENFEKARKYAQLFNFKAMEQEKYDILFKGHDHERNIAIQKDAAIPLPDDNKYSEEHLRLIETFKPELNTPIELDPNKRYAITTGPYFEGEFLIFEHHPDDRLTVTFY